MFKKVLNLEPSHTFYVIKQIFFKQSWFKRMFTIKILIV